MSGREWLQPGPLRVTGPLRKKLEALPLHIQYGIVAYRQTLNEREDWIEAVANAIRTAEAFKGGTND